MHAEPNVCGHLLIKIQSFQAYVQISYPTSREESVTQACLGVARYPPLMAPRQASD